MASARSVVVTGGASGIGRECVATLLREEWTVFALDLAGGTLDALRQQHADAGGRLHGIVCDVRQEQSVAAAFEYVRRHAGELHALICSAGVLRTGSLEAMPVEDFDAVFSVNVRGAWLSAKYGMPFLQAGSKEGVPARIVFVSSISSIRPKAGGGAYAASKAALNQLVRVMAVEVASKGVLVNAVAPGTVDTPFIRAAQIAPPGEQYRISGVSPLGRVANPSDVVSVIRFLLSDGAAYITGTVIPVDGGTSAAVSP